MIVTFKGQLLTAKYIISYIIISLITFGAFFLFYYFKGYDILFQVFTFVMAGPVSFIMILVPPLLLSLYLTSLLASTYFPKQITIALNNEDLEIHYGQKNISIPLKEISTVFYVKRIEKWARITIRTNKSIHINVGDLFNGIENPEIDAFLNSLKKVLTEQYKLYYTPNTAVKNSVSFTLSKTQPRSDPKKLIFKISLVLIAIFIPFVISLYILLKRSDGENLQQEVSYPASNFVRDKGKVYVLKVGNGYFELKDADVNTFKPMYFGREYGTVTGKDSKNVFSGDEKITGVDIKTVQYLGLSYIKDIKNVFYKTQKIDGADVQTFQSLKHSAGFNTLAFKFAKDKNKVYYKNLVIKSADPSTITSVNETVDYLKDNQNAFYRTQLLPNVNTRNFNAVKTNYQIVYASDGKKHFVNGRQFPSIVNNRLWGTKMVDINNLVILQKPTGNPRHLLFSDNKAVYYYDDQKEEFICADDLSGLKPIGGGCFADDKFCFFTETRTLSGRKYGSYGSQTNIYKANINRKDMVVVHHLENATVYKNGNSYYISIDDKSISLYHIKDFPLFEKEIIQGGRTYVSDLNYFEQLSEPELVLKIKTRNRTRFEEETD